ncbi:MAG: PhnD/SsuA/transferrin family substrate-binding protein [Pseudomonadota bacterium]|nr:PhnD/SsuA/transferrin family substrate-binding protein [Pseudomonadota bacterium]
MVVSEGTSGETKTKLNARYTHLAELISRVMDGQRIDIIPVRDFGVLQDQVGKQLYDFVFVRPAEPAARAVRDNGYKYVASGAPDTRCLLIAPTGSKVKSAADLKNTQLKLVFPEKASYITRVCLRELKDMQIDTSKLNINYVKEQGLVVDYIDHKLADVGALGSFSKVAKKWTNSGQPVFFKGRPVPIYPLVAGSKINDATIGKLQNALGQLHNTEDGREFFEAVGMESFDTLSAGRLQESLSWIEKR